MKAKPVVYAPRETCLCCGASLPPEKRWAPLPGCACLQLPLGEYCAVCTTEARAARSLLGYCDQHCRRTFIHNNPKGLVGKLNPIRPLNAEPKPMPEEVKEMLRERTREKRAERGPSKPKVADADLEARYGPLRAVKKIIDHTKGGCAQVLLVCGHNKTVHHDGVKESRCRACKKGGK